jgi:hypothetical protein
MSLLPAFQYILARKFPGTPSLLPHRNRTSQNRFRGTKYNFHLNVFSAREENPMGSISARLIRVLNFEGCPSPLVVPERVHMISDTRRLRNSAERDIRALGEGAPCCICAPNDAAANSPSRPSHDRESRDKTLRRCIATLYRVPPIILNETTVSDRHHHGDRRCRANQQADPVGQREHQRVFVQVPARRHPHEASSLRLPVKWMAPSLPCTPVKTLRCSATSQKPPDSAIKTTNDRLAGKTASV